MTSPAKLLKKCSRHSPKMKREAGQSIPPFRARPAFLDSPTINATLDYMEIHLSPDQEAHLAALAASVGRPADELVQEALAEWEQRQAERQPQRPKHTPAEAAARILELRKGNILPPGETIKNLINYGRA